jgi:hypothetical protein
MTIVYLLTVLLTCSLPDDGHARTSSNSLWWLN